MGSWPIVVLGGRDHTISATPVDAERTVAAALATGQRRIAVTAADGEPGLVCPDTGLDVVYSGAGGAGHSWCAMREIAAAAEGTGLQIMVLLNERHIASDNRWLDSDGYRLETSCVESADPDCHEQWDPETRVRFRDSFKAAAQEVSRLSVMPGMGSIVGMAINDGDVFYCAPHRSGLRQEDGCMDEADLIEIWQAGKTCEGCNPDFQFWAYAAANEAAARVLPGSHILGQINSLSALGEGVSISAPPELETAHDGVTPVSYTHLTLPTICSL